jgi:hypothetical protein
MKLTGKVVRVESGTEFTDGKSRLSIKVGDEGMFGTFRVINEDLLSLDDRVTVHIGAADVTRAEAF